MSAFSPHRSVLLICALGVLCAAGAARAESSPIDTAVGFFQSLGWQQHGSLKNETAYRIVQPTEFTKIRNQLILTETGKFSDQAKFKISGRFYYDAVYDGTDNFSKNVASSQKGLTELRDTYLDYSSGPVDIRLGKQQIVWGEAVGLFFADVVNAKDLRESILPDFDMIRIPEWGADIEYAKDAFHAEAVWIPAPEFNKLPVAGSEFFIPPPVPQGTSWASIDPVKPHSTFENSEAGLRLSYLMRGWDVAAFYLHTWDKSPVLYRTINAGVYDFTPQYKRLDMYGATFSKAVNDIVLKGELVYNRKGYFSIFDDTDPDGVVRRDFIDYLLGADYTFFEKIDTNLQFMQRIISGFDKRLVNEKRVNNAVSFWISRGFLNNTLDLEFLVIAGLMEKNLLYRPKLTYKLANNWKLRSGFDIFQGDPTGTLGQFRKKSRVYLELFYLF
jgi:hypothetical protein